MRTVLQHLKQNLKHFYSGNVSIDSHAQHFRFFLKVLQYLIIDFHALHFRIFKFYKLVLKFLQTL